MSSPIDSFCLPTSFEYQNGEGVDVGTEFAAATQSRTSRGQAYEQNDSNGIEIQSSGIVEVTGQTIQNTTTAGETQVETAPSSSRRRGNRRRGRSLNITVTQSPVEVIDLSNVESPQNSYFSVSVSRDDVEIISSTIPPIVDLCSPTVGASATTTGLDRQSFPKPILSTHYTEPAAGKQRTRKRAQPDHEKESPKYVCPICYESPFQRDPTVTKCGHVFCKSCIEQAVAITHKCPLCNVKLQSKNLSRIYF